MKLTIKDLEQKNAWEEIGIKVPSFNIEEVYENTVKNPKWVHFGAGNIFRIFIGGIANNLIEQGEMKSGINCIESFDFEMIEKIYKPFDNLVLAVTLNANGDTKKEVLASLGEALTTEEKNIERVKDIFADPQLQIASYTITEKGYALTNADGVYFPFIQSDIEAGPQNAKSVMAITCAMLLHRYKTVNAPIAMVSMDNCSHNGEKLQNSVITIAKAWREEGFVEDGFIAYLEDESKVSFPWSMIDKITPRPAEIVKTELESLGLEEIAPIITSKNTYAAPYVNAEGPQYLVIEDKFPNGRPALEKAGVYMTDRETVNKVETMKVTTCLNPLHTALAVYGCVLGYDLISEEMGNPLLRSLVDLIGPIEGMKTVVDPKILSPEDFVKEVIEERLPNPYMPDAPQRIATDTSQKVGIRYGETIKAYVENFGSAKELVGIPLAIAGWFRYLLGVNDNLEPIELSSDPMLDELTSALSNIEVGNPSSYNGELKPLLANESLFGIDLYKAGIGDLIETMFIEEIAGKGAVLQTLEKYLNSNK